MAVLIFAPEVGLETVQELVACIERQPSEILHGILGSREALGRLEVTQADILHIATHGSRREIMLSDGPLDTRMLEVVLQAREAHNLKLVFANFCNSIGTAIRLQRTGVTYAIGWDTEVDDEVAGDFARNFYRVHSRNGGKVRNAFITAVEFMRKTNPGHPEPLFVNGDLTIATAKIASEVAPPWWALQGYRLRVLAFAVLASNAVLVLLLLIHALGGVSFWCA